MNSKSKIVLDALRQNWFDARFARTSQEAVQIILDITPTDAIVGFGDSMTLKEIKIIDILKARGNTVLDIWEKTGSEKRSLQRKALHSDVFLVGCNAITEKGELVSTDAVGNRVAGMIFGPDRVIVVVGENKIVRDRIEAFERIRKVAAPLNNQKYVRKGLPCMMDGCAECHGEEMGCRVTVIMGRKPRLTDVTVILLEGSHGF